jgi:hypothetical protein
MDDISVIVIDGCAENLAADIAPVTVHTRGAERHRDRSRG